MKHPFFYFFKKAVIFTSWEVSENNLFCLVLSLPLVDPKNLTQVMRLKSLNHLHSCYFFKFTFNFLFLFQPSKIRCFVTFEMKMYF